MVIRCLIVDDSDHFRRAARGLLEVEGIAVVGTASVSDDALRQADDIRPDVALVDIELGGENGFDLARRLVAGRLGTPRVILISTHAEGDFAEMIAVSPAIAFLSKSALSGAAIRKILGEGDDDEDLDGPVRVP